MKLSVIIPAAGRSSRFKSSDSSQHADKLLADLGGRSVLLRTVEIFAKRPEVGQIIVAVPPDRLDDHKQRIGPALGFHGGKLVAGGTVGRWETVKKCLEEVSEDCTHIAVHDAARPVVSEHLLDRLFEAAGRFSAVVPAMPVTATLKRIKSEAVEAAEEDDPIADMILGDAGKKSVTAREVAETVDRQGLYAVQTPQVFESSLLRRAYEAATGGLQDDLADVTDDAMLVERLGEPVYIVDGEVRNIKITTREDLDVVRQILGVRPEPQRPVHKRF